MVRSEPTTGKKAREIRRFKKNSSKLPTGDRFPVWRLRGLGRCGRPWRSWGGPGVWPPPAASPAQPASSPAACPADPAERPPASPPPQVQSATVKKKKLKLFLSQGLAGFTILAGCKDSKSRCCDRSQLCLTHSYILTISYFLKKKIWFCLIVVGCSFYTEIFLEYYTMILQRPRIIVGDAGFEKS